MIGAETLFKGLQAGGQLLQPPTVIPLKPPIVCICAVCAHVAPPPPRHVAHTATLQIFGPFIYSFASFYATFSLLYGPYMLPVQFVFREKVALKAS